MDFDRLWHAYPSDYTPCRLGDGTPAFDNQCAIRFGLALGDGGVDLRSFRGVRCWHGHGGKHLLRGEEIAAWMKEHPEIFGQVEIRASADETTFLGRRGLIFCRNFWGPGNQGDHIDLWNRNQMKGGSPSYIARSEEVWFWEVDASTLEWLEENRRLLPSKAKAKIRFRKPKDATDFEKNIGEWLVEESNGEYDHSNLPDIRYSRIELISKWGLQHLVRLPKRDKDWWDLYILSVESPDSIAINGRVRIGKDLFVENETDYGGRRMHSWARLVPGEDEPLFVGYVFDGLEYHETFPS